MNYCGFDSGKKSSQFCIVNEVREILEEKRVATNERALQKAFRLKKPMKIVIEASTKSFWIAEVLESLGHQIVVVDPRRTKAIGSALIKHDKLDARVLATLCQANILAEVHRPSREMRYDRMPIVARDALVRSRTQLICTARSLLDSEGIEVADCATERFTEVVQELAEVPDAVAAAIQPLLVAIDKINEAIGSADKSIRKSADNDPTMKRLQTVDGVGPIVAAIFVNAIRDPDRFKTGRQVGAYLGLVPSLYQSGETHRKGSITKQGSRQARFALTIAANSLLRAKRPSELKTWALALVEKKGRRQAIVALARKLASVLWAMWKRGTSFVPDRSRVQVAC